MDRRGIEAYLANFKGGTSSYPFGPEALVFKVMDKMYALVSQDEAVPRVTLKVDPEEGLELTQQHDSVVPGYYMNKKHWVTISLDGELPDDTIERLSEKSYALVVGKLSKKARASLTDATGETHG